MRTKLICLLVVLAALGILAACAPAASAPTPTPTQVPAAAPTKAAEPTKPPAATPTSVPVPTPKPASLKYGSTQTTGESGVYIALDKGYFKEQGITQEETIFRNVAELIAPLSTGQLDVTALPLSTALLAAVDRGMELKIVGGGNQQRPNLNVSWIVLRKDLADSGRVKTPADLKGMKIAIPSLGSAGEMMVQMMLEQAGLKPQDVEIVVLPFADQAAAFGNKAIAAAYTTEPNVTRGVQEGLTIKWIPQHQFFDGRSQTLLLVFGSTMLKDQDLARRWMYAYLKGTRDYMDAIGGSGTRTAVIDTLIKHTTVKDPKLYEVMELPYIDPNGQPDKKSMDAQYKWFVDKGLYTGKKTLDDMLDLSHVEYAAQRLGKR